MLKPLIAACALFVIAFNAEAGDYKPRMYDCRFDGTQYYDAADDACYDKKGSHLFMGLAVAFGLVGLAKLTTKETK